VKHPEKVPMAWSHLLVDLHFFSPFLHKTAQKSEAPRKGTDGHCSSFDARHFFAHFCSKLVLPSTPGITFFGHFCTKLQKKVMLGVEGRTIFVQKWPTKVKDSDKVPMALSYLLGVLHFFWPLLHKTRSSFDARHHFF